MNYQQFFIVLYGPTATGKTELAAHLAQAFPIEIINMDSGQLYTPLTIGTAKPIVAEQSVPHHLFDIVDSPIHYSVTRYRAHVIAVMQTIWQRNAIPVLVGGSGFYLKSLFFPLDASQLDQALPSPLPSYCEADTLDSIQLWNILHHIDPDRAAAIHKKDEYRIRRALSIWQQTGKKPSTYKPIFSLLAHRALVISLIRERAELYERINRRTFQMLESGWIEEVKSLDKDIWYDFIKKKKFIGYDTIIDYLAGTYTYSTLTAVIQQKTRNYAKRQIAFWHMLSKQIKQEKEESTVLLNLTLSRSDLYIKQLINAIMKQIK